MAIHVKDIDTSQADFQTGTLTDVEADAGDYLRLVDTPVLSFDGVNDCVELPSLNRFDPYTIEFWVKLSSDDPGNSFFSDWDGNDYTTFRVPNGRIEFGLYDGTSRVWTPESSISILDEWHHCCGINNGSEIKLYLDGGLVGSTPHSLVISTNAFLVMEDATAGTPNYAKGNICDIRFWDHERTPTEIQDNMYKRLNGDEPGLVAYYKLDEGTGTVATDSTGTNDGTINGATWVANEPLYFMNPAENNNRLSPQLDLSAVGMVESSQIGWTGYTQVDYFIDESSGNAAGSWEYTFATGIYFEAGEYYIEFEGYDVDNVHEVSLRLDGPEVLDLFATNTGNKVWLAQSGMLNITTAGNYDVKGRQHIDISHVWGVRNIKIQSNNIETRISTDNGATWSAWKPCTNGGAIPDLPYGTDASTALLECRQSLSTSDPTVTPRLESLTLEINSQKVHAANLNMDISAGNKQISILRAISTALDVSTEYVLSGPWTKVSTPSNTWSRENGLE
jgi:hypothetical protein